MTVFDPRPARDARWHMHAVLTAMMGLMALQLWLPTQTYGLDAAGHVNGNWWMIGQRFTEHQTGTIFAAVFVVGIVGLYARSRAVRLFSIGVLATAHATVAATFVISNIGGVASILLGGFAYEGFYLVHRRTRSNV